MRMLKFGVRKLVSTLAPIIRFWESSQLSLKKGTGSAPIFIIGAPRTGSTILYQALTNAYQVAYIDNAACIWHRNLRFGMWLSQKKYRGRPHNNFKAEHGNTRKYGGNAPSECGQFWYRWLPKNRHFIDHHEVTPKMLCEIRTEVLGASAHLKRPLVFKNLNVGQRLRLIHKAFPDAKVIFVRRDPRFVTRSILKARQKAGVKEGEWWSVMPPNVSELTCLSESQMCAAQVYFLEKQIDKDLLLFPKNNVRELHYQTLSESLIHDLGRWIGVSPRVDAEIPVFHQDDPEQLSPAEWKELDELVKKYPFKKELFV